MAEKIDEQLVQQIVERVLEVVLRERADQGGAGGGAGPGDGPSARVRPPAGVCTGDYSRFAELAGRGVGAAPPAGAADQSNPAGAHSPIALTGIVTAQQLQEAIDRAPDGTARLAHDARLTPLANDFARQHPEKLRRVGRENPRPEAVAKGAAGDVGTWLWWADGHCPAVQSITTALGAQLRPSATPRSESGLAHVIGDLAHAVEAGGVAGGLLFVRSAARAVLFANRCRSLRAAVGTCPESVEQGIREIGANVLVIEYPYVDGETMRRMVQCIVESRPQVPAEAQRYLNELQRGR